jgi:signal transduction histidine kinase
MNFYLPARVLFLLIATIANLILGLWVYKNNPKSATSKIFGLLGLFVSVWVTLMYIAQAPQFIDQSLLLTRLTIFFAAPMNALFFLLAHTIPENSLRIHNRWILAGVTFFIMGLSLTPYVFSNMEMVDGLITPIPSFGLPIFGLVAITENIAAVYILFKRLKNAKGTLREQLRFVMLGILLMFGLIIATIFIPVMAYGNATFVPLAPIFTLIFLSMTAYAIIYHGLLDVRLIVARTISFVFVNVFLALIYGLTVFIFLREAPLFLDGALLYISSLFVLATALLSFEHAEKWITVLSNKIFFKKEYDPDRLLDQLTRIMANTIDLDQLTDNLLKKLTEDMNIMKGVFIVVDNHKVSDVKGIGYSSEEIKALDLDILFHSKAGLQCLIFEEMDETPMKKLLRDLDVSIAMPISVDNKDIAVLMLGRKLSGDIYFDRDIQFLDLFAREAGIAIQNSKSFNEIKLFNKELESRVEARTRDLEESQKREIEKAKDVSKLKDEFFFVATHELRAPITAIRGFLELVSGSKKKMPKELKENLGDISYASDHLNQLVNDLLEIARSESESMKINTEPIDLDVLVDEIFGELSPIAKKSNVKLRNGTFYSLKALADRPKVKEVLVNLINNAIKYNREDGLVFVQVVSVPGTDRVFVEIRDTGFGIPLDQQDKIFGKFFRAASEDTSKILGTGLGLFLTRMLIQKMGGDISFSSIPGEGGGTTFSFYLNKA